VGKNNGYVSLDKTDTTTQCSLQVDNNVRVTYLKFTCRTSEVIGIRESVASYCV